jgi:hypothetical protein
MFDFHCREAYTEGCSIRLGGGCNNVPNHDWNRCAADILIALSVPVMTKVGFGLHYIHTRA